MFAAVTASSLSSNVSRPVLRSRARAVNTELANNNMAASVDALILDLAQLARQLVVDLVGHGYLFGLLALRKLNKTGHF